ncbi:MAG TPA: DUF4142 domain-containing protein [Blastocatellia bacterium]|nr:DUF4142 domain-containing protein [Blastocatellia bacterium]
MIKRARVLVALVLVGGFALLAVGCASNSEVNINASGASGSGAAGAGASPENQFMTEAAMGGMAEVEFGRIAAQKGYDEEVRQFAQRMVDDHSRANAELKRLASQKSAALPTELDRVRSEVVDRLSKLSGSEFDKTYMGAMVEEHTKAVSEFELAAANAQDAELKSFASKAVPTLREHLAMAKTIHERIAIQAKPNLRRGGNTGSQ